MINMNTLLGAVKGDSNANNADNAGLSALIDSAKNLSSEDLARYQSMSKMELLQELKNSEHSATVISLIKGLLDKKFNH